ncbi:hypothetical protein CRUP_021446 [Coryphaenoides rupestris]|nr:hypothetical protein CRUP_021446 [Coryphaenoides rupestris]
MSKSTWTDVLSDAQRCHLRQFLPQFPEDNVAAQDGVVGDLFNNQNFSFGNPLHLAQRLFRDGYFNPEVVKYRQLCAKSQRKRRLYSLQQYFHRLLKQLLVSRKDLLELAVHSGLDMPQKRPLLTPKSQPDLQEPRVARRVGRILRESWPPVAPPSPSSPTTTLPLRVLPSLSTQDMKTAERHEFCERDLKSMLQNHREKRKRHPDHPDLVTSDIHLGNMLSRVNIGRKVSTMALFDLAPPKKKIKEERRKKRLRATVKLEAEDPCEALVTPDTPAAVAPSANHVPPPPDTPTPTPPPPPPTLANVKEEVIEESPISPALVEEISVSFFNLLETIMKTETLSELVLPALQFLAGEAKDGMMTLPTGFSPYVEFGDQSQQWRWIGPSLDAEKDLSALCQLWIDSKDLVVKEQQRYDQPHKAFTFRMHGFQSVVGPVKGVFDKEMSLNKAREHTLLRSDRPAYVTILSLVRDAAARLPNGEGTRAEICELLKDSQFLAPDVTSAQVNTVVSGALDRLHYEKDP